MTTVIAVGISSSLSPAGYAALTLAVCGLCAVAACSSISRRITRSAGITFAMLLSGAAFCGLLALGEAAHGALTALLTLPVKNGAFRTAVLYQGVGCSVAAFFLSQRGDCENRREQNVVVHRCIDHRFDFGRSAGAGRKPLHIGRSSAIGGSTAVRYTAKSSVGNIAAKDPCPGGTVFRPSGAILTYQANFVHPCAPRNQKVTLPKLTLWPLAPPNRAMLSPTMFSGSFGIHGVSTQPKTTLVSISAAAGELDRRFHAGGQGWNRPSAAQRPALHNRPERRERRAARPSAQRRFGGEGRFVPQQGERRAAFPSAAFTVAGMKFIVGLPTNSATNRFAGWP